MLDSIASVQARIGAIQSRIAAARVAPPAASAPTSAPAAAPASTVDPAAAESFEAQLAAVLGQQGITPDSAPSAAPAGSQPGGPAVEQLIDEALRQTGDTYRFGASTSVGDPDPSSFDCSELVKWAAGRNGVQVPDGSWNQYLAGRQAGLELSVEQAMHTRGALLFRFESDPTAGGRPRGAHVAISLGDGRTIEARGRRWGVGTWGAAGRFTHASRLPGFSY